MIAKRDYLTPTQRRKKRLDFLDLEAVHKGRRWSTTKRKPPETPSFVSKRAMLRDPNLLSDTSEQAAFQRVSTPEQWSGYMGELGKQATSRANILLEGGRPRREIAGEAAKTREITSGIDIAEAKSQEEIAGLAQKRKIEAEGQYLTRRRNRLDFLRAEQQDTLVGIDQAIQTATAAAQAAYAEGDTARGQFYERQLATLQNRRMEMTQQQMSEAPVEAAPEEFMYEAPPAPIGSRLGALEKTNERANREVGILMARSGLTQLLGVPAGEGQPATPSMLDKIAGKVKASDENAILTMEQLLASLQTALGSAQTPEARQYIINIIRAHPAYAQIFTWQDADKMLSREQFLHVGIPGPAWPTEQDRYNMAAQLAQQIVQLVEGSVPQ